MPDRNYAIVSQRQGYGLDIAGTPTALMAITFRTLPSGVVATEEIPLAQYSAANVDRVLTQRAALIEEVHAL